MPFTTVEKHGFDIFSPSVTMATLTTAGTVRQIAAMVLIGFKLYVLNVFKMCQIAAKVLIQCSCRLQNNMIL